MTTSSTSLAQAVVLSDAAVLDDLARWLAAPRELGGDVLAPDSPDPEVRHGS